MLNNINIDRKIRIPLYLQIKKQIQDMILNDTISKGINLPPTRKLARTLGVNRNTIVAAYNELVADGLIETHAGSGSSVKRKNIVGKESLIYQPLNWPELTVFPKATIIDSLFNAKEVINKACVKVANFPLSLFDFEENIQILR